MSRTATSVNSLSTKNIFLIFEKIECLILEKNICKLRRKPKRRDVSSVYASTMQKFHFGSEKRKSRILKLFNSFVDFKENRTG